MRVIVRFLNPPRLDWLAVVVRDDVVAPLLREGYQITRHAWKGERRLLVTLERPA